MKLFEVPMVVMSLLGFCFLSGLDAPPANADFIYGEPANLGPMINNAALQAAPYLSPDGRELYFLEGANTVTMVSRRATPDSEWGPASAPGLPFRPSCTDHCSCITPDGLTLLLSSDRPGGCGSFDLWMSTRATTDADWNTPTNLGPGINSEFADLSGNMSPDGLELYFNSDRPGGIGGEDIYVSIRATKDDPWGPPLNLGPTINCSGHDSTASISPDGPLLFYTSWRPGGYGICDVWVARRTTPNAPWDTPVNCGSVVNTPSVEWMVNISADGSMLYFHSDRPGGFGSFDIWQTPILPIVDFNSDGQVDLVDLVMLIDAWGTDNTLYDIGPFAWGDGKVDIEDLKVFVAEWEKWEKQNPPAVDDGQ